MPTRPSNRRTVTFAALLVFLAAQPGLAGDRPPVWIGDSFTDLQARLAKQARGEGVARSWAWAQPDFDPDGRVVRVSFPIFFGQAEKDFPRFPGPVFGLRIGDPAAKARRLAGKAPVREGKELGANRTLSFLHQNLQVEVDVWTRDYRQGGELFEAGTIRAIRVAPPAPPPDAPCRVPAGALLPLSELEDLKTCLTEHTAPGHPKLPPGLEARLVLPRGRIVPDAVYDLFPVFENTGSKPVKLVFRLPCGWVGTFTPGFAVEAMRGGERVLASAHRNDQLSKLLGTDQPDRLLAIEIEPGGRLYARVAWRAWMEGKKVESLLSAMGSGELIPMTPGRYELVVHLPLDGKGPEDPTVRAQVDVVAP